MSKKLTQAVKVLAAVADPNRLRILKCLQQRPCCVCEIVQATGIPQPRVSRHLKALRDAGLVGDARDAQWVEYSLAPDDGSPEGEVLALVGEWLKKDAQVRKDRKRLKSARREAWRGSGD